MKKILVLVMMLFSLTIFGASVTESINFGISPKELLEITKSKPLSNSHDNGSYAVYYFQNVKDPLGVVRQFNSFAFDNNKLFSVIFDSITTEEEHKEIIDLYSKNAKTLKMNIDKYRSSENELVLYNLEKMIKINKFFDNHTFINVVLFR